ncbi:MAG: ribokinase [Verrucomicrobiaceae bacterium]|nr:MAG: ribokinase [Verrucomicrobiaceae bacterium]
MKQNRLLVVGSSNLDLTIYCDRLPGPGETLLGGEFSSGIGGKGANQAAAASRAGAEVTFLSAIGNDSSGEQIRAFFSKECIETLWVTPGKATGTAIILVDKNGTNSIVVAPGANAAMVPDDVDSATFHGCSHVLLSLEIPMPVVMETAKKAREAGCVVILNPAPASALPDELLRCVNILVPNEHEVGVLACSDRSESAHEAAARRFFNLGGEALIITLGADGAKMMQPLQDELVPGFVVPAVDTVGAGDCFCGVLAASLAAGKYLTEAVRFANRAASLSVQERGAIPSFPSKETIFSEPP